MDEHIRDLERRVQAGDLHIYPTLLSEYLRAEYLMRTPIELAAYYGNEAAKQVVGEIARNQHHDIVSDLFYRQLDHSAWVREFFLKRGAALAEHCFSRDWDLAQDDAWIRPRASGIRREVKDFVALYQGLDPHKDQVSAIYRGFIDYINSLNIMGQTYFDYPIQLLAALCVAIARECWWIVGGRIDNPLNVTVVQDGWHTLYSIFDEDQALNFFRKGDESDAYVQTLLELKIGLRLDNWLLRPYTNYHGLQNVPPE